MYLDELPPETFRVLRRSSTDLEYAIHIAPDQGKILQGYADRCRWRRYLKCGQGHRSKYASSPQTVNYA